jgi:hypothetical protein
MSSRQFTNHIFSGTTLLPPSTGVQRERASERTGRHATVTDIKTNHTDPVRGADYGE